MSANAGSRDFPVPEVQSTGRTTGLLGGLLARTRAERVCNRLDTFIAPALEEEDFEDASDLDWVRVHNAKVRESVKGSADLTKRLAGDDDELKIERPRERVLKGEAFMVKMLQQRMRNSRSLE